MKHSSLALVMLVAAALIGGCGQQRAANLLPDAFPGARKSAPEGILQFDPPMPLQDIAERPVDLATMDQEQANSRVTVSADNYPKGRKDLPWLGRPQRTALTDGEFNSMATPFWSAPTPAWVEVELAELSYVSQVVVEAYSVQLGVSEFSVHLFGGDGAEIAVAENVQLAAESMAPESAQRPPALSATFPPRVAKRVKIIFSKTGAAEEPNVYIRSIRVMGIPSAGPFVAAQGDVAEPLRKALDANRHDLASFTPDIASAQVAPTGELVPDSASLPWLPAQESHSTYWAVPEPAAVTVDLGKACYIDQVVVWPLTEGHGVGRFYVKMVTPDGDEVDTSPPANVQGREVQSAGTGLRPQPLATAFEPVLAQKLRFYFPEGGLANDCVYVHRVQVLGIPAAE